MKRKTKSLALHCSVWYVEKKQLWPSLNKFFIPNFANGLSHKRYDAHANHHDEHQDQAILDQTLPMATNQTDAPKPLRGVPYHLDQRKGHK
jgi:hypothetical protein